jgi:DNA repair and recombination protein RAD52
MESTTSTVEETAKETPTQQERLKLELHPNNVMSRSAGYGGNLAYVSGEYCIRAANGIFGFGKWSHRLRNLKEVVNITNNVKGKDRFDVSYIAIVAVTAIMDDGLETVCEYEDVGYGNGNSYTDVGVAIESATKEAVTDAMKRCLRHFGSQFGNSLYNEKFRKVVSNARPELKLGK